MSNFDGLNDRERLAMAAHILGRIEEARANLSLVRDGIALQEDDGDEAASSALSFALDGMAELLDQVRGVLTPTPSATPDDLIRLQ